jgi:enamine deaminase RidA (YjgF/YER057c/UK114 family)
MKPMLERTNPAGLHQTPGYSHVTVTDAARLVFLAGQCPLDEQGQLAGPGDLTAQVGQVVRNVMIALSSAGACARDVVRTVIYVVSADRADLSEVWRILRESPIAGALESASTLLGVSQLGYPGQLVEIDVTAALSGSGRPDPRSESRPEGETGIV